MNPPNISLWNDCPTPVIGMVHLPPLPGSPRGELAIGPICDRARRDAEALAAGGAHGVLIENFGDAPFFPNRVGAETIAAMTSAAIAVRSTIDLPMGVNVLRNDGLAALAVAAAAGAQFIRVNVLSGVRVTDQGFVHGIAHDLLRERRRLRADSIQIFADVDVKHSAPLAPRPIEDEVAELVERAGADVLIVTGSRTGGAASRNDVQSVRQAAVHTVRAEGATKLVAPDAILERTPRGSTPVLVGSGVTAANIETYLEIADGFIIGSSFKAAGDPGEPIDAERVRELIGRLR